METKIRIALMEAMLARHQNTNVAADSKVGTLLGFSTTMLVLLVALATRVTQISTGVSILIAVTAGGLLLGLLFLSLSALPRTSKKSHSLIYFGSIARTNIEAFVEDMKTITEEEYLDDLARQCHRTAEIAMQKYLWIQRAQWAWYTTLLPWLLTVYQLYKR